MAGTLKFELVSPERRLASCDASEVQLPAVAGEMTAMAGHAPVITSLRPGVLKVVGSDAPQTFVITGGFAEITAESASVLAETAIPTGDVTSETLATLRSEAQALAELNDANPDALGKTLADFDALATDLGL